MPRTIRMEQTIRRLSKEEAAAILKISPRRVLEFVQAGALKADTIRDPRTNQMTKQIDADDVEKLREERENPKPQPSQALMAAGAAIVRKPAGRPPQTPALLETLAEARQFASWPPPLYLTLEQAIRYTGLGESELRRCAKGTTRGPRGALVYRRAELDSL